MTQTIDSYMNAGDALIGSEGVACYTGGKYIDTIMGYTAVCRDTKIFSVTN